MECPTCDKHFNSEPTPHIWFICTCNKPGCMFCDGGLGLCTVCGGFEGTLTTDCCSYALDPYVLNAVYKGNLDYIRDSWVVKPYVKKGNSKC